VARWGHISASLFLTDTTTQYCTAAHLFPCDGYPSTVGSNLQRTKNGATRDRKTWIPILLLRSKLRGERVAWAVVSRWACAWGGGGALCEQPVAYQMVMECMGLSSPLGSLCRSDDRAVDDKFSCASTGPSRRRPFAAEATHGSVEEMLGGARCLAHACPWGRFPVMTLLWRMRGRTSRGGYNDGRSGFSRHHTA
jgi:hypothetical protein